MMATEKLSEVIRRTRNGTTHVEVVFGSQVRRRAPVLPLPVTHFDGQVPQDTVEQVGGLEVRRVDEVVGALRVLRDPLALIRRVVEHQIRHGQDAPLVLHEVHLYQKVCIL